MRDEIDDLFADDLAKLAKKTPPLELQVNAAKVKAAQDPSKPGAEKPDLGAPGKGRGGKDPMLKASEFDPKSVTFGDSGGVPVTITRHYKKRLLGRGMKQSGASISMGARMSPKQASADDTDVVYEIGVSTPAGWERPDVVVDGQVTDRIDDHFVNWMQSKADEDVVKVAGGSSELAELAIKGGDKALRARDLKNLAKGALAASGVIGAGVGIKKVYEKGKEKGWEEASKTAGVIEHDENLDLLERLRRRAEGVTVDGDDA